MATPTRLRDIYIIRHDTVAAAAVDFAASQPVPGTGRLVQLSFVPTQFGTTPAELRIELRWNDIVPANPTEFLAGELVFPKMVQPAEIRGLFRLAGAAQVLTFPGPFEIGPTGRRMTGRLFNNTTAQISCMVYFVVENCHGVAADPQDGAC